MHRITNTAFLKTYQQIIPHRIACLKERLALHKMLISVSTNNYHLPWHASPVILARNLHHFPDSHPPSFWHDICTTFQTRIPRHSGTIFAPLSRLASPVILARYLHHFPDSRPPSFWHDICTTFQASF